jgi:TDG/mug DNA glycosylase family protein
MRGNGSKAGDSMPITERLLPNMQILFIGYNPSLTSYEKGFNYAGRSNRFYKVLYLSGLTRRLYKPEESPQLLEDYGFGFTNIVARPTKTAAEITKAEYAEGRLVLMEKLERYRPRFACYVGKGVYEQFARPKQHVPWGFQETNVVEGVRDFVAPSTSGLVRMKLAEQVAIFEQLADAVSHNHSVE